MFTGIEELIRPGQGPWDVLGRRKVCGWGQVVRTAPTGIPAPAVSLDLGQSNLIRPGNLSALEGTEYVSVSVGTGHSHLNSPGHKAHGVCVRGSDSPRSHEIHIGGATRIEKGMWNLTWPWAILRKGTVKIAQDCQEP